MESLQVCYICGRCVWGENVVACYCVATDKKDVNMCVMKYRVLIVLLLVCCGRCKYLVSCWQVCWRRCVHDEAH